MGHKKQPTFTEGEIYHYLKKPELLECCKQHLKGPLKDHLANLLVTHVSDKLLADFLIGNYPVNQFHIGQEVYCKIDGISTYDIHLSAMRDKNMLLNSKYIKVKIIEFKPYENYPYTISFPAITMANKEIVKTCNATENYLLVGSADQWLEENTNLRFKTAKNVKY